jgi:organic radical activating enzyme
MKNGENKLKKRREHWMHDYNKLTPKHNFFYIDWILGTLCNYKCSYCPSVLNDGRFKFPDIELAKSILKDLKEKYNDKDIILVISGGEVTVWKDFPEFVNESKKHGLSIQLVTNGSKSLEWWDSHAELMDLISITIHWEYADKKHINDLCLLIKDKTQLKLTVMATPDKIDQSIQFAYELSKIPDILIELKPIRKDLGPNLIEDYTPQQLKQLGVKNYFGRFKKGYKNQLIFTDKGQQFNIGLSVINKENCWKGWLCYAGLETLKISESGNVFRANCFIESGNSLGNIYDKVEYPTDPVVCPYDFCKCITDIRNTKLRMP